MQFLHERPPFYGTHGYTYDSASQLTRATHPASPVEAFTYDAVGNRLSSTDYPQWIYDANNRLTGFNGTAYTHDENGNIITKTDATGTTAYTYDSENKLTRIDFPGGGFVEYVYDGLGRRIEKNVGGTITRFVYDLEDVLFEYDGSNNITARYTHGPGIDDPIAMDRGGANYFYHPDGLGSITGITDSSKQPMASYGYDAFGNITSQTGSLTNPYTYTGREHDPETGLYYYRARYYDPKIGRFLQPDPLDMAMVILIRQYFSTGFSGNLLYEYVLENPLIVSNSYPYVENNPINWVDPWGLKCKRSFWWRVWEHFKTTNETIPGLLAPPGLGFLTAAKMAGALDSILPLRWALIGFRGVTLGGAAFTSLETGIIATSTFVLNYAAVSLAFEVGVGIGSMISATIIPCEEEPTPCQEAMPTGDM